MFEKFDIDDKNIFKVCVVATMSSGKSTFINSIIGEEVMPEKNEACTARTMAVLDNDSASVKKAHIIRRNGAKEVVEIDNREVLDRVNNDEDVVDFLVETNIQSIANTSRALMLVDTPGVNNSADERHGERTEAFLKQMDMGVIIYLLNATQLATNDDSILLQIVAEHIKKKEGKVKIIFVINKIDALDLATESIAGIVKIAKEYIENHDIQMPVIYPLSALAAKSLRMALYRKEMTKRELRKLEDIYEHYRPKGNNMLAFAMVDDLSGETYEIGEEEVTAQELQRAIDNTGITAIEKKLENFMREIEQHYAPEIVIKSQLSETAEQEFQKRIEEMSSFPQQCEWTQFKVLNAKIETNKILQRANAEVLGIENISIEIDFLPDLSLASIDINDLITNMEETKHKLFNFFMEGKYSAVKHVPSLYFSPEQDEISQIRIKSFYLMSEAGSQWETVSFGHASRLADAGKDFYLYNEYVSLIFEVTKTNAADVIALLDTKIPVKIINIVGLGTAQISIHDVESYLNRLESEELNRLREIQNAEDQLRRTYKGIIFNTEEEKTEAVRTEEELQLYCQNLKDKTFEEIWQKKEQIAKLPNAIFAGYSSKLISAADIQENREKNVYFDGIEIAGLVELDSISEEIYEHHYSDAAKRALDDAIAKRRLVCQQFILDDMTKDIEEYDRETLKQIILQIEAKKYNSALTAEYISRVNRQCDILETRELQKLCSDIEQRSIPQLEELERLIKDGKYQDKFANQYFSMIYSRIEFLHVKNLEKYCMAISGADRDNLNDIKKKVEGEECRQELKDRFYELIDQRNESLDYEELCQLTEHIEEKPLDELEKLYKQLQAGSYNEKFIKLFLIRVRIALEQAQQKHINDLIGTLQSMSREQIIEIESEINKCGYADRITALAKDKITERIYILDMYELISMENNFDRLSLDDIEQLRNRIRQKNVCERSRNTYLKKLKERENIIAYQLVSQLASYAKQTLYQYGLSGIKIKIACFDPDYMQYLQKHFDDGGVRDYSNIPVLFMPECSAFAITKTEIYYRVNSEYNRVKIADIRSFSVEKKLFGELLAITFANGNMITLSGGINKKNSQAVVGFLTNLVQNINNTALLAKYQPYTDHVVELKEEAFEGRYLPAGITEQYIENIFLSKLYAIILKTQIPSIKYAAMDNWSAIETKVCSGFGIAKDSHIVMYYDRTLFNSAKEGIAVGTGHLHFKTGTQKLISIPFSDIYEVNGNKNQLIVTTVTNNVFSSEFTVQSEDVYLGIIATIDEFVKGMQFINSMATRVKTEQLYSSQLMQKIGTHDGNRCPNCNAILKNGAKFCSQCGTKIVISDSRGGEEYCFCSVCGNKIIKGKKFCSNCGAKVN